MDCLDVLLHRIAAKLDPHAPLSLPARPLPEGLGAALDDDLAALPPGDAYGDALLAVLEPALRRSLGAFHTPPDVAARLAEAAEPTDADTVLDPACGTGALLAAAADKAGAASLIGLEADPRSAALAALNLPAAAIHHVDALTAPWPTASVIVTNPPFGRGREAEFVRRCVQALPVGGRLWAIVPRGLLTNRRASGFLADLPVEELDRIDLPPETFADAGTRIATVIVGLRRTERPVADAPGPYAGGPTLGDLCTFIGVGHTPGPKVYAEDGVFLLKVGNLTGRGVDWRTRGRNHVDPAWAARPKRAPIRTGDVVLTAAGHQAKYVGLKVDLVHAPPPEAAVASGEVMVLRADPTRLRPARLWLWLRSPAGYAALQSVVRGQTAHLYADDVAALPLGPATLTQEFPGSMCDEAEALIADSATLSTRSRRFDR